MTDILIVDDNEQNRYLLETMLGTAGFNVKSARNGVEALDLARKAPPDLIITDILMPVMDGFQLCRLWKMDDQLKHVPFIFYTATYTEPKDEQFALSLGADRFITKPQDPEVLFQMIQELLKEFNKGILIPARKLLGEEMEILRKYNEVLFHKLEKKVMQLESEIAERKKAQESLARLNLELESRVEARTKELKDAVTKMVQQEKLVTIGKLARNLSHELRNPLGVISNSIYFLSMKLVTADEKIKKHLSIIQDQAARATKIIDNLLEITRLKPGEQKKVDLHALLKETMQMVQVPEKITVKTNFTASNAEIQADPRALQQAFLNIITNAFQAMADGGELEIKTSKTGDMIDIAFKDTGDGIPAEHIPRLFEPLFSTRVNGIGLGLTIAKEIVESVKGKIEVESAVNVGSTFMIRIPLHHANINESS
ncbi:MAG: response regulator [Candidatus Sigynarchaeota archaeon]